MSSESDKSDIHGKKIFFLYPTSSVQNQVITELVQIEYEVYTAKNPMRLARALKNYPNSIVFVNIEEGMTKEEWGKWINTLVSLLPDIRVGVLASVADEEQHGKYINNKQVKCGYITLKVDMSQSSEKIIKILEILNAKGRRKYVRANTEHETNAALNLPHHGEFINGTIRDISVVGFSCTFTQDPNLAKNSLVKDIQIKLQSMLLNIEAITFGSRMEKHEKIYVFIFSQRINPEDRVKIRKYIQQNLQGKMNKELV
jgi:hypothetical protein